VNNGSADGNNSDARFNSPYGITVDSGGNNVYVADTVNHTIRKLTLSGTNWMASTIAGLAGTTPISNTQGQCPEAGHQSPPRRS